MAESVAQKLAFTKMVDTLKEIAARAGQKAYLMTKKSREERMRDFQKLILKLSILSYDEEAINKREDLQTKVQG